jgi:hypothetical protein
MSATGAQKEKPFARCRALQKVLVIELGLTLPDEPDVPFVEHRIDGFTGPR